MRPLSLFYRLDAAARSGVAVSVIEGAEAEVVRLYWLWGLLKNARFVSGYGFSHITSSLESVRLQPLLESGELG